MVYLQEWKYGQIHQKSVIRMTKIGEVYPEVDQFYPNNLKRMVVKALLKMRFIKIVR